MGISSTHARQAPRLSTRELSQKTWPDFERLFQTRPAPGAYACWCMHHHRLGPVSKRPSDSHASMVERNHQEQKALVESGSSHGVLVYAGGEPVGWCQFGLRQELPRMDRDPKYRELTKGDGAKQLWRITCFVVRHRYRGFGVASTALRAALVAIKKRGGGLVEAYPVRHWSAYARYRGTVSMFKKEGFEVISPLGASNLLMRRAV